MDVCAWCGRTIQPGRMHVYINGASGCFDTFDCADRERRRRLALERVGAILPTIPPPPREAEQQDVVAG